MSFNTENPSSIFSFEGPTNTGPELEKALKTSTLQLLNLLQVKDSGRTHQEIMEDLLPDLLEALETSLVQNLENLSEETHLTHIYPEQIEIS